MRQTLSPCFVLLAAAAALAADVARLPFDPLAGARQGDWAALRLTAPDDGATAWAWEVLEVTERRAVLSSDRHLEVVLAGAPPAVEDHFMPLLAGRATCQGVATPTIVRDPTEVVRTVDGREFTCTRVTFGWGEGTERVVLTAWLSPEVKVSGVVALVVTRGGAEVLRGEVSGWGPAGGATWGARPPRR